MVEHLSKGSPTQTAPLLPANAVVREGKQSPEVSHKPVVELSIPYA